MQDGTVDGFGRAGGLTDGDAVLDPAFLPHTGFMRRHGGIALQRHIGHHRGVVQDLLVPDHVAVIQAGYTGHLLGRRQAKIAIGHGADMAKGRQVC